MKVRKPCQAGAFYAGNKSSLTGEVEGCFLHRLGPGRIPPKPVKETSRILGLMCPHAGFMYSGPAAAHSYLALAEDGRPEACIILGPNHTGLGSGVSIMVEGGWETPLGILEIDSPLSERIQEASGIIDVDEKAHQYEHSIEVQLPFLQYLYGSGVKIVPICMMMQDLDTCKDIGRAVYQALGDKPVVVIASSDMTHYEPQESAASKDGEAIKAILALDPETLHRTIEERGISMCGYGPVTAALYAAREAGALSTEKLAYYTSGDVTKDYTSVVGYCSMAFKR